MHRLVSIMLSSILGASVVFAATSLASNSAAPEGATFEEPVESAPRVGGTIAISAPVGGTIVIPVGGTIAVFDVSGRFIATAVVSDPKRIFITGAQGGTIGLGIVQPGGAASMIDVIHLDGVPGVLRTWQAVEVSTKGLFIRQIYAPQCETLCQSFGPDCLQKCEASVRDL